MRLVCWIRSRAATRLNGLFSDELKSHVSPSPQVSWELLVIVNQIQNGAVQNNVVLEAVASKEYAEDLAQMALYGSS